MSGAPLCGKKCQKRLWRAKIGNGIEEVVPIGLDMPKEKIAFDEGYVLLRFDPLKSGGYGGIYLAQRKGLSKETVAVKVFGKNVSSGSVEKEIRALASLGTDTSPYVVKFFDVLYGKFRGEKRYMIVMEYIYGVDVDDLVAQLNQAGLHMDFQDWLNFTAKAFDGLAFLHAHGIAHRDVKPSNIMVRSFYKEGPMDPRMISPVLIDFNFSCIKKECGVDPLGSYGFVGPEGLKAIRPGAKNLNDLFKATDVWGMTISMIYLSLRSYFVWILEDMHYLTYDHTFALLTHEDWYQQYLAARVNWIGIHKTPGHQNFANEVFNGGLNLFWKDRKTAREMETLFRGAL
jgi:serine/threonine protein kinase